MDDKYELIAIALYATIGIIFTVAFIVKMLLI